jgi:hypothetical protein
MESASGSSAIDPQQHAKICADNAQLREERDALKQQLDWFKRQLLKLYGSVTNANHSYYREWNTISFDI